MYSSSFSVLERVSISLYCQSELIDSDLQVLNKLFNSDKLSSLDSLISVTLYYNLYSHSVIDEFNAHILYAYTVIFIDNIIKLITYKQTVKLSLCDK